MVDSSDSFSPIVDGVRGRRKKDLDAVIDDRDCVVMYIHRGRTESMTGYGTSLHCYVVRPPTYIYYKANLQFVHTMLLAINYKFNGPVA